jgi:hypothetical protein
MQAVDHHNGCVAMDSGFLKGFRRRVDPFQGERLELYRLAKFG